MIDQYGREISAGRLFSGTMKTGQHVYLNNAKQQQRIQQVFIYCGIKPEQVEEIPAGNVIAVSGISGTAGETVTIEPDEPFEELKHIFEPVITKAIEAKNPNDLSKLVEVLRKVSKEDPSIKVEINEETGENLIHGMGELHLEIVENRIKTEKNVDVNTSEPIVVYRESITKKSPEMEGKSPNKHNKFYMIAQPLPEAIYNLLVTGAIPEGKLKKKPEEIWAKLIEAGMKRDDAKAVREISGHNLLMETTKGIVHIGEVIELCMQAFEEVMKEGPLARERSTGLMVNLTDCSLHEDAIHRGPAQVVPAVRDAIKQAMLNAGPILREPQQTIRIDAPGDYLGEISKLVQSRRGQVLDVTYEGEAVVIKSKLPVAEMFGFTDTLRSGTEGRGFWALQDSQFERIPPQLQDITVKKIRQRKGLAETQI
jgi:elongation factor 2